MNEDGVTPYELAGRIYWETKSVESALAILTPCINAGDIRAMSLAASIYTANDMVEMALECCRKMVELANSDDDYINLLAACEGGAFDLYPGGRDDVYRRALCELAQRGNWVVQIELALNYLNGWRGFAKSEVDFLRWIKAAADLGAIDAVCYYIEFLVKRGMPVEARFVEMLEREVAKNPADKLLLKLLKEVKGKSVN